MKFIDKLSQALKLIKNATNEYVSSMPTYKKRVAAKAMFALLVLAFLVRIFVLISQPVIDNNKLRSIQKEVKEEVFNKQKIKDTTTNNK